MDYVYIRAWEKMVGVEELTLKKALEQAHKDNAPEDAVFFNTLTNAWVTFSEITNITTLSYMKKVLNENFGFNFKAKECHA